MHTAYKRVIGGFAGVEFDRRKLMIEDWKIASFPHLNFSIHFFHLFYFYFLFHSLLASSKASFKIP